MTLFDIAREMFGELWKSAFPDGYLDEYTMEKLDELDIDGSVQVPERMINRIREYWSRQRDIALDYRIVIFPKNHDDTASLERAERLKQLNSEYPDVVEFLRKKS